MCHSMTAQEGATGDRCTPQPGEGGSDALARRGNYRAVAGKVHAPATTLGNSQGGQDRRLTGDRVQPMERHPASPWSGLMRMVQTVAVRLPAGGVFIDGDLRTPERATGLVIFAHGSDPPDAVRKRHGQPATKTSVFALESMPHSSSARSAIA